MQKCFCADFTGFWETLTCSQPKDFLKQDLLCISITTSFGVNNLRNILAMRFNFVSNLKPKFNVGPINAKKKKKKKKKLENIVTFIQNYI